MQLYLIITQGVWHLRSWKSTGIVFSSWKSAGNLQSLLKFFRLSLRVCAFVKPVSIDIAVSNLGKCQLNHILMGWKASDGAYRHMLLHLTYCFRKKCKVYIILVKISADHLLDILLPYLKVIFLMAYFSLPVLIKDCLLKDLFIISVLMAIFWVNLG